MTLTLVIAILFTIAFFLSLWKRTGRPWWLITIAFLAGAIINWLRYLDIIHS
jgi:hypothetical protein